MSVLVPKVSGHTLADDPERRAALRAEKRRDLAAIELRFEKIRELEQLVDGINADSDQAADRHSEQCSPLQAELAKLDESRIASILKGAKAKQKDNERRSELLKQLSEHNRELESITETNNREVKKLREQIDSIRKQCTAKNAVQNALRQLADPRLLDQQFVSQQRLKLAHDWCDVCQGKIQIAESQLNDPTKIFSESSKHGLRLSARRWRAAFDDARTELQRLQTEQTELLDRMLNDD